MTPPETTLITLRQTPFDLTMKTLMKTPMKPILLALALLLAGCAPGEPPPSPAATPEPDVVALPPGSAMAVAVAAVGTTSVEARQQVLGQITYRPEAETIVHASLKGRITRLDAAVGDQVAAGAPLGTIASAELGTAQAAFLQASGERALAAREHNRQRQLHAAELASKKELDEAAQALAGARVRYLAARETLRVFGVGDAEAQALVRRERVDTAQRIRAPRAGTVVERGIALGDLAAPEDAQPMFRLLDLATVRVEADLPERDLAAVRPGQDAAIVLPALGERVVHGRVVRLAPVLDRESRSGRALIDVPNPQGLLRPGMSCRVAIATGRRAVLAVPAVAVQREASQAYVYVALGTDRFRERPVTLGARHGDLYEVASGLTAGERVATTGSFDLRGQARKAMFGGE